MTQVLSSERLRRVRGRLVIVIQLSIVDTNRAKANATTHLNTVRLYVCPTLFFPIS